MHPLMRKLIAPTLVIAAAAYAGVTVGHDNESSAQSAARVAQKIKVPKKPDVVLLIMDEFPVDQMLDRNGRIDATRYPNFAALAKSGTWFKNGTTTYDSTTRAVPEVMDAKLPRNRPTPPTYVGHPQSIYTIFGKRRYRIDSSQEATSICPPRYCPKAANQRPAILPELQDVPGRRKRINDWISSIGATRKPTLFIKHVLLPHGPYLFLPSGKQTRRTYRDALPGMNGPVGFGDPFLTDHNQQRLQLQIGFADRVLGRVVAQMKKAGIYDTSALAVTADHGIAFQVGVKDRRTVTRSNIDEIAPVPLFIKAPGQLRGGTSSTYARTIDIVPTIADLLHFKMPYRADGRSVFSRSTKRRRYVRMLTRDLRGAITVPAKTMEARRRALLRKKIAKFGDGNIASLYTGIGPNRGLIGRTAASLKPAAPGGIRSRISNAADMRSVNPRSELLPTQVAGQFTAGTKAGARRDLAVAVNGVIQAVGRSFYLKGDRHESFALMVPELSLHPGNNDVSLYEVTGRGTKLRLVGRD